ncbi:MarR family transcriptional regulator [Streptomyces cyaneofuscatus]|uniref:MarR family transcriptional regulator n=1 Tax=Streptomyces cyaneofuscatus TaxID=66883 RepID=UPI00379145B8
MATKHTSPAQPAPASSPAYPMAKPGYGKRSASDQHPRTLNDFSLLPTRERYVAGYIDRLPDEAAMGVKVLARQLPLYGQQAIGSALRALSVAGHLRRVRYEVGREGQVRWVSRTFWSRTARDNEWWNAYLATERARFTAGTEQASAPTPPAAASVTVPPPPPWVPEPPNPDHQHADAEAAPDPVSASVPQQRTAPAEPPQPPTGEQEPTGAQARAQAGAQAQAQAGAQAQVSAPPQAPAPSAAYQALTQLGQVDHRVGLSAEDCAALEGLAAAWLERGVTAEYVVHALTAGLPLAVDSPIGFVRRRLETKMPPHQPTAGPAHPPPPGAPARRVLVECAECGAPGRPEALPDGLCRPCRSGTDGPEERARDDGLPGQSDIATYVSDLRNRLKLP